MNNIIIGFLQNGTPVYKRDPTKPYRTINFYKVMSGYN